VVDARLARPGRTTDGANRADRDPAGSALVVFSLSLGGLAFAVLQSLVTPALPVIARDLNVSTGEASWVLTAYLLSASVLTPVLGRLGDLIGKRGVLLAVLGLLGAGAVLAALAPNLPVLIVARVLQGVAGAIMPLSIGIVRDELPPGRVSVVIGLLSATIGIGAGVGIVAAGPIVEHLSWPWLFWIPLVAVVVALAGTVLGVPRSPQRTPGRLDLPGAAILSVSLVSLLLAVDEGRGSPAAVALSYTALVTLAVILVSCTLTGAGIGLAFAAMPNAIIDSVPASHTGEATGVNTIARTIGSSVGTAVIAAILAAGATPEGLPSDRAFTVAFWICAGVGLAAVIAALFLGPGQRRPRSTAARTGRNRRWGRWRRAA
jgi:MFS family permease